TFMKVGTGVGPTGTVSKRGPVTQRVSTTISNNTTSRPTAAHHLTGAGVGGGAATTGPYVPARISGAVKVRNFPEGFGGQRLSVNSASTLNVVAVTLWPASDTHLRER